MTTENRVPYATARDCCDAPGDVFRSLSEHNGRVQGGHAIMVRCQNCGHIQKAERQV
jgi:uncharacterized Zn finger protein